ncbi:MAG: hypothetical protein ACTSVY_02640 [Candidatus Helarchaeota archaeon]
MLIEKEFINDPAQQQVHIARKILAKEAKLNNMSYFNYIKLQVKKLKQIH